MIPKLLLIACVFCCIGGMAQATPLHVDFVRAEVPPNSQTVDLPFLLLGGSPSSPKIVFLKFKVPDIANVLAINSFMLNLTLFDNNDNGGEAGYVAFAQPGPNVQLFGFSGLNGTTASAPATVQISLCPCEIDQVFDSLQDGTFRIRIERESGSFFVGGATASIDATMVPEPSSVSILVAGFCAATLFVRVRRSVLRIRGRRT